MNNSYTHYQIHGKDIYVFEDHATALQPWAEYRRRLAASPYLLTLDHHTDTRDAFTSLLSRDDELFRIIDPDERNDAFEKRIASMIERVDFRSEHSVQDAVSKLRHDEHIDAAIRSGIISHAFILCYDDMTGMKSDDEEIQRDISGVPATTASHTFPMPYNKAFIIGGCRGMTPGLDMSISSNVKALWERAIEATFLDAKIQIMNQMTNSNGLPEVLSSDYILDIDLDYFHLAKSIEPGDASAFYNLIRKAAIITVATEPDFVGADNYDLDLKDLDKVPVTSDRLLSELMVHMSTALGDRGRV